MTSQPAAKVPDVTSRLRHSQILHSLSHLSEEITGLSAALLDGSLDLMLGATGRPSLPLHAGIMWPVKQQHCEISWTCRSQTHICTYFCYCCYTVQLVDILSLIHI